MAAISWADAVGALTGNEAARAKLIGGVVKFQKGLEAKAEILGQKGGFLGGEVFRALARGAQAKEDKDVQKLVEDQTGVTLDQAKSWAWPIAAGVAALAVVLWALLRRKGD